MKAPGVSGVDSYSALCIAAKGEEHRTPLSSNNASSSSSSPPKGRGSSRDSTEKCTCFMYDQPGHIAINCPKQRTESKGRGKSPFRRSVAAGNSHTPVKQVQVAQKADITIMRATLFAKLAVTARLHKRDLKKADRIPRMYDQRTFSLDGRLDLEFLGLSL